MTFDAEPRTFEEKLLLGAFYTPPELTDLICNWAIRSKIDHILEPSFGGCGFLSSSKNRLRVLKAVRPGSQIYGCVIDPVAFKYLESTIGPSNYDGRFLKKDFLKSKSKDFKRAKFSVVVGNPPYLSRHRMPKSTRTQVNELRAPSGVIINRKSALWVYFIYHSLDFLDSDGRMAWVLPASFLHADYARDLRLYLKRKFAEIHVVMLPHSMFAHEGVGEPTVALLLDGYKRKGDRKQSVYSVSSIGEFDNLVNGLSAKGASSLIKVTRKGTESAYEELQERNDVVKLGKLFDISIGLVTGDNRYFVISRATAASAKLPRNFLKPVVASSSHLIGLTLTAAELKALEKKEERVLLFRPTTKVASKSTIRTYLKKYPIKDRDENVTFSKRAHWYIPPKPRYPDAFMACMDKSGPRFTLNRSGSDCTNTLYRLFASTQLSLLTRRLIAISMLSSFTALSAEKLGRRFKSGSLKIEPSTAKSLSLIVPATPSGSLVRKFYKRIDALVRQGEFNAAREASDEALIALTRDKELGKALRSVVTEFKSMRTQRLLSK